MTVTLQVLEGPRLKVQRANSHINNLINLSSPLSRDFYEIAVIKGYPSAVHMEPNSFKLSYKPKKPIARAFALIIGDAVHNLRASLDHLATGIVRAVRADARKLYFPFDEKREGVSMRQDLLMVEKALPGSEALILDKIKPYLDNKVFYGINKLDNIDKHNLILPTVALTMIENINAIIGSNKMKDCGISNNADYPFILIRSPTPIFIQENYYTSAQIVFSNGSLFENEPVIPTLTQMSKLVSEALDAFESLIGHLG